MDAYYSLVEKSFSISTYLHIFLVFIRTKHGNRFRAESCLISVMIFYKEWTPSGESPIHIKMHITNKIVLTVNNL